MGDPCLNVACPGGQMCVAGECVAGEAMPDGGVDDLGPPPDGGPPIDRGVTPDRGVRDMAPGDFDQGPDAAVGAEPNLGGGQGCSCDAGTGGPEAPVALLVLALGLVRRRREGE